MGWQFVISQMIFHMRHEAGIADGKSLLRNDTCHDHLLQNLSRQSDHLHFTDSRIALHHLFNLTRRNVFSPADDHILHPACNIQKIPRVQVSQVSRMQPSFRIDHLCRFLRKPVISLHDIITAHTDFSILIR